MRLSVSEWDLQNILRDKAVSRSWTMAGSSHPILNILKCDSRIFTANAVVRRQVEKMWARLGKDHGTRFGPADLDRLKLFITSFSNLLAGEKPRAFPSDQPGMKLLDAVSREKIKKALRYIVRHFAAPVNLTQLAVEASLSRRHFERLFKKAAGVSPSQFLMEQRMQRTLQLLRRTDLKIESIIEMVGFRNRGHFFRAFTKRTGLSPEAFRKNLLTGRPDSLRISPLTR
jgi:AraC-like DNA-binding protein